MPLKINDLLKENKHNTTRYEILKELKKLNKIAYKIMYLPRMTFKQKYRILQKTPTWKQARELLLNYFLDGKKKLYCKRCGRELKNKYVLHHFTYNPSEIFTPSNIRFLCSSGCHADFHDKRK